MLRSEERGALRLVIGVTTYRNSPAQLQRFARSLALASAELPGGTFVELLCTDNSGEPGLGALVGHATSFPADGNVGFAAATNALMRSAFEDHAADAFITANPDGLFHHRALERLLAYHSRFPTSLVEAQQFPEEHPKTYDPASFETPWCSACCLLLPRRIYEAIGALDARFFMYLEDVDYSWRARAAGLGARLCPEALFAHDVLDRPADPLADRRHLESARYLAWKWRDHVAQAAFERRLEDMGHTRSLPELPGDNERMPSAHAERIACFGDSHFAFARCRW